MYFSSACNKVNKTFIQKKFKSVWRRLVDAPKNTKTFFSRMFYYFFFTLIKIT